jgi:hypothetical protein
MHTMALIVDIKINTESIGDIYVRRLSARAETNAYEWQVRINGVTHTSTKPIIHRYSAGALELIRKVIEEVSRMM